MSVIDEVMNRNIPPGGTVLEVGSGAGRWSEYLQKYFHDVISVFVNQHSILPSHTGATGIEDLKFQRPQ